MMTPLRFFFAAFLLIGFFQEAKDDGSFCAPKGGTVRGATIHECHCRLMCDTDEDGNVTYGEEGGADTSPTRCKKFCVKNACQCHPEPDPKDCGKH